MITPSAVTAFFTKAKDDLIVIGKDIKALATKLVGEAPLAELELAAESTLKTEFGQAVLADAELLLNQVKSGETTVQGAITSLTTNTINASKATGIILEQSLATALAALAIAKVSGVLGKPVPVAPPFAN